MDAMAIQVEALNQNSFDMCDTWHYRDVPHPRTQEVELVAALFHASPADLANRNTNRSPRPLNQEIEESSDRAEDHHALDQSVSLKRRTLSSFPAAQSVPKADGSISSSTTGATLCVSTAPSSVTPTLAIHGWAGLGAVKRVRAATDADGSDTAATGSKSRRLNLQQLSPGPCRPLSCRLTGFTECEAAAGAGVASMSESNVAVGNRRFVKLASILAVTARTTLQPTTGPRSSPSRLGHVYSASYQLRRAAALNHFRLRTRGEISAGKGDSPACIARRKEATGSQVPDIPLRETSSARNERAQHQSTCMPGSTSPSIVYRGARPSEEFRPSPTGSLPCNDEGEPINLQDKPVEDEEESLDPDEIAFPTSEHESRYEAEDEEDAGVDGVYADFAAIFGSATESDVAENQSTDPELQYMEKLEAEIKREVEIIERERGSGCYEDVLDELDGIPPAAR